ncbi:Pre-mRNA-splicing factor ATP-dependent RNA helicase PRP43, partial [Colletotrichum shisoi]
MEYIERNKATAVQVQGLEDATLNPLTGHAACLASSARSPPSGPPPFAVLSSETGSGKSTQVPQLLVYDEQASGLQIACTQPRRLAATGLAGRVAQEMGVVLGEEVGYKIRGDYMVDKNSKKTRLTYMTEGVLLNEMIRDRDLLTYACVVIDEAHERTTDIDLLLGLLKKLLNRRNDLKVVIMSATIDAELFQTYFDNCPLVYITERSHNVEILYLAEPGPSFVVLAASVVAQIHRKDKPGNILVFLPGENDIEQVCSLVRGHIKNMDVFPLYSALPAGYQRLALDSAGPNRKCIVSTNIAETSLTIDNVAFVVDTGLSRQIVHNPRLRLDILNVRPISQASARQRAGRAGRTMDGVCYRLYSREAFDRMAAFTEPAIRCSSVSSVILRLAAAGYRKAIDFDWLTVPHPESIARAAQDLQDWGFMKDDAMLSQSGRLAAMCPLDPIWYRAITVAEKLGCSLDVADIALLCSSRRPVFLRPAHYRQVADLAKTAFAHPLSDHLTLLNAFNAYIQVCKTRADDPNFDLGNWCSEKGLDMRAQEEVRSARGQLVRFLRGAAMTKATCASITNTTVIRKALAIAFCTHTAVNRTGDEYRTVHENAPALLSPLSALVGGSHEWVMYTTFSTAASRQYLQTATAIDAEWLVVRSPHRAVTGLDSRAN